VGLVLDSSIGVDLPNAIEKCVSVIRIGMSQNDTHTSRNRVRSRPLALRGPAKPDLAMVVIPSGAVQR
jgi:hypothetical protein